MNRLKNYFAALLLMVLLSGCAPYGFIYTKITTPLDVNMTETKSGLYDSKGNVKHVVVYNVRFFWGDNSIGDITKQSGLKTVYYADIETLSILGGLYSRDTVHIYGE